MVKVREVIASIWIYFSKICYFYANYARNITIVGENINVKNVPILNITQLSVASTFFCITWRNGSNEQSNSIQKTN